MKVTLWFLVGSTLLFIQNGWGQNLVPNYSFEDTAYCLPHNDPQECAIGQAAFWYNPSGGSPDYINNFICGDTTNCNMPKNYFGFQYARTGIAYAHIYCFETSTSFYGREYISVQLTTALVSGRRYCVEFHTSLGDTSRYAIDQIGVYFSVVQPIGIGQPPSFIPQVASPASVFLSDTANWIQIQGVFVAVGGEQYITIGNFDSIANNQTVNTLTADPFLAAYYYIDDVCVKLIPEPNANAGQSTILCLDSAQEATIGTPAIAGYQYAWQVAAGIVDTTLAEQTVSPTTTTTYYLWVTDTTDTTTTCKAWAMDSVTVYVIDCDTIPPPEPPDNYAGLPNIFSPNSNGVNDRLFVRGTNISTVDLHVYNRLGEEVFSTTDVNSGWDGTYQGKPVNAGVYVYWCRVTYADGSEEVLKGNITLIR